MRLDEVQTDALLSGSHAQSNHWGDGDWMHRCSNPIYQMYVNLHIYTDYESSRILTERVMDQISFTFNSIYT